MSVMQRLGAVDVETAVVFSSVRIGLFVDYGKY